MARACNEKDQGKWSLSFLYIIVWLRIGPRRETSLGSCQVESCFWVLQPTTWRHDGWFKYFLWSCSSDVICRYSKWSWWSFCQRYNHGPLETDYLERGSCEDSYIAECEVTWRLDLTHHLFPSEFEAGGGIARRNGTTVTQVGPSYYLPFPVWLSLSNEPFSQQQNKILDVDSYGKVEGA